MKKTLLKNLKNGEFFTRKPNEYPEDRQVLIRSNYCKENKKFSCYHFDDVNKEIFLKGETIVYTDFIF